MDFLKDASISEEDLDTVSGQISDEVIKFFPWDHFTEHQQQILKENTSRIIRRKVREIFGKPLPTIKMRSPRAVKKS